MSIPIPPNPIVMKKATEQIGLVQGQTPGSINEWYVAQALDKDEIPYIYQYSIMGGRNIAGGQVIDFLCFLATGAVPVYVNGAYWHSYRKDPDLEIALAEAARVFKTDPIILEEEETSTREKALAAVRQKVEL